MLIRLIQGCKCQESNVLCGFCETEETNKTCQQVIRDNLHWCNMVLSRTMQPCMFEEVEGCVPKDAISSDDDFMTMFNKVNQSRLKSRQWCIHHKRFCPVLGDDAAVDYNCGGLPCWDFSMAGLRRQEQGETRKVFIAYAAYHCSQRTPLLLIENVKACVYFNFSNGYVHAKC